MEALGDMRANLLTEKGLAAMRGRPSRDIPRAAYTVVEHPMALKCASHCQLSLKSIPLASRNGEGLPQRIDLGT